MLLRRIIPFMVMTALLLCFCTDAFATAFTIDTVTETDAERLLRGYDEEEKEKYLYVHFGRYPFTKKGEVKPCLWRVLAIENGYAFLLNEYCVDLGRFHHEKEDQPEWKDYDMFDYMNETMLNTMFTPEEQAALQLSDTLGRLFILDNREFMTGTYGFRKILTEKQWERECALTPYARNLKGSYVHSNGKTWYWSRSCRNTAAGGYEHIIGYDGHISMAAHTRIGGIRPACRVDLSMLDHATGSGTEEDPYVFEIITD